MQSKRSLLCVISCQNGTQREERIEASRIPAFSFNFAQKETWAGLVIGGCSERAGGLVLAGY